MSRKDHHPRVSKITDLPEWLQVKIFDQVRAWAAGALRTCPHSPTRNNGISACFVAWKPDLVTCPQCTHLAVVVPGSVENRRCDCCDRVVPDTLDDRLFSALVRLPGLSYALAVCTACRVHRMP